MKVNGHEVSVVRILLAVALLWALASLAVRDEDTGAIERERVEAKARADSLRGVVDSMRVADQRRVREVDSLAAVNIELRIQGEAALDSLAKVATTHATTVREALPEPARPSLDSLLSTHEQEKAALREIIARQDTLLEAQTALIASLQRTNRTQQQENHALRQSLAFAEAEIKAKDKPLWREAGEVIALVGIAYAGSQICDGPCAAGGVAIVSISTR